MTTVANTKTPPATIDRAVDSGIMPWPIAAAGLTGLVALILTAGPLPIPILFAVAVLASYVLSPRLEGQTFNRWWVRIALLFIIIVMNQGETGTNDMAFGGTRVRNILAQVYASEFVIQCWRRSGDPIRSRLIAVVASGLLMLSASNTFDEKNIRFVAPVYALLIGLALFTARSRRPSRVATVLRVAALVFAMGLGGVAYVTIDINRGRLTELTNNLLGEHFSIEATGMSSSPSLGETFGLRGSTARVLRVQHMAGDGHLRGMAFDTYNQGHWGPGYNERRYRGLTEREMNPPNALTVNGSEMQVERLVGDNPIVYAPLQAKSISTGEVTEIDWSPDLGGPIRSRARPPFDYSVSVATSPTYQGILARPIDEGLRERYSQLPPSLNPKIFELAKRITAEAKTDEEKVEAVTSYLIGNYTYSLRFKPGRGEPLTNFLLADPKRGAHCEYFASASAILLRCVGIPTRYITGYMAHEQETPDTIIVRQRDAHAWSEAWVKGVGWVTVEATPGDGRPDHDNTPVEWWRGALEKLQDGLQAFAEFLAGLSAVQVATIVGVIVGGGILYGIRLYRKRQMTMALASFAYAPPEIQIAELIVRFESVFSKRNAAFRPERTYREHIDALSRDVATKSASPNTIAPLIDTARQFIALYDTVRFGNRQDAQTLDTLRQLVEQMERTQ